MKILREGALLYMNYLVCLLIFISFGLFACNDDVNYTPTPTLCTAGDCDGSATTPNTSVSECRVDGDCPSGFACLPREDAPNTSECVEQVVCVDEDGDGYGNGCEAGPDCDDTDYFRNPAVDEVCNQIDDNCDGRIDENRVCVEPCDSECEISQTECVGPQSERLCVDDGNGCGIWLPPRACPGESTCSGSSCTEECVDFDQDGYGTNCPRGDDCDDRNPLMFPGNPEACDGYDNDCDNAVDEGRVCDEPCEDECDPGARRCSDDFQWELTCQRSAQGCFVFVQSEQCPPDEICLSGACEPSNPSCEDFDEDGYGVGCDAGPDCDDTNPNVPSNAEVCDGIDNDCDGAVDNVGGDTCARAACSTDGNSTRQTARVLGDGEVGSSALCGTRPEYWDLGVIQANTPIMLSTFVPPRAAQDLTVTLVRMEGDTQIFVADFTGRNIVESIVPEVGGRMYLIVTSFGGFPQTGINGAYSIAWTRTYPSTCQPEPNNGTPSTTQTITPDRLIVGDLCRSDLDFYRVSDVEPGDVVSIELNFAESPEVLVDVWRNAVIVSPDQRVRNGHRHTHARVMDNEPLIFAVRPFGPAPTSGRSYILTVKRIRAAELECDNPDRERPGGFENDSINTAQDLPSARDITGFICPGDVDVFYVGDYQVDDQFDARLAFDAAQNLDAYLFRDDINFLLQNALTDSMPEILPTRIPSAGSYYVMVIGRDENQTSPYTLEVD